MSARAVEVEGMAEMVQRVADAIETSIPGTTTWVFSASDVDEFTDGKSAIEIFFAKARASQRP